MCTAKPTSLLQALTMYATEIAIVNAVNLGSTLLASGDAYRAAAGVAVYSVRRPEHSCA